MDRGQAKRLILLAVVISATVATVRQIRAGQTPEPAIYVGAFIAAVTLTLLAEASPQVAGGLAAVLVVSTILVDGVDLARIAQTATGRGSRSRPAGGGAGGGAAAVL